MSDLMEKIQVFNTLTRSKEPFRPLQPGKVGMYVCGVTVYDACHLGHARAYVAFDVIRRFLERAGFEVEYVQNFTDIDDKIITRANEIGKPIGAVTERYIGEYFDVMDRLNVKRATRYPKATEHIEDMFRLIEKLIEKNCAYEADGNVFFAVDSFEDYGRLGRIQRERMLEQERGAWDSVKRGPGDFALWKKAKEGEPFWDSPWGKGRPGWHIECSAMSGRFLGDAFDIHGGGQDLIFPHHENEIAQSRCATGGGFARYWLHNGFVKIDAEKMAKSLGNFKTVADLLKKYDPDVLRLFLLGAHYRQPIDFTQSRMEEAMAAYERFEGFLITVERLTGPADEGQKDRSAAAPDLTTAVKECVEKFDAAMCDDFNSQEALAALFDLVRTGNTAVKSLRESGASPDNKAILHGLSNVRAALLDLGGTLGLFHSSPGKDESTAGLEPELIGLLIEARGMAKKSKNWEMADRIRDGLGALGIALEDTPEGALWKKKK